MHNNSNLESVNISHHKQNVVKFRQFIPKILRGTEFPTSINDHNINSPNLDVVNINAYAKLGQIRS